MAKDALGRVIPNLAPVAWEVTGQTETMGLDERGQVTDGYRVTFRTGKNQTGSVFIAKGRYTPDTVRAEVGGHAALLDHVAGMSNSPPGS